MTKVAQPDTTRWLLVVWLALGACAEVTSIGPDAGKANHDAGSCQPLPCPMGMPWSRELCACAAPDAGGASNPQNECQVNTDCTLVQRGCCGTCLPPGWDQVLAVPKSKADETRSAQCPTPSTCGACLDEDPDPLAPLLAAACVEQRCKAVDLRADDISSCTQDSDCVAVSRGCCPAFSEDPINYVGVHQGADRELLACFPIPPCHPPDSHPDPLAFCASDGHCAVRRP